MSKKIGVVSLGCDKNRVDTEKMLWYLSDGDYEVTADYADADIIIVNTCAFIESARKEAIETILEMAKYKTDGKCKKLIATGCLVEKYRAELEKEMPEVDAFLGIGEYEKIRACIGEDVPAAAPNDDRITRTCVLPTDAIIFARFVPFRLFAENIARERLSRCLPKRKNSPATALRS